MQNEVGVNDPGATGPDRGVSQAQGTPSHVSARSSRVDDGPPAEQATAVDQPELPEAYLISRALAQATLDYLSVQPYREVFALVAAFQTLPPAARGTD